MALILNRRYLFLSCLFCLLLFVTLAGRASHSLDAVDVAAGQIGKPYLYGGKGPDAFDCSGLVQYSYAQVGVYLPPSSVEQATIGIQVSDQLQRGDLLFFTTIDTQPGIVTHVGLYEGDNVMINAVSEKFGIRRDDITSVYWSSRFLFARRIIIQPFTYLQQLVSDTESDSPAFGFSSGRFTRGVQSFRATSNAQIISVEVIYRNGFACGINNPLRDVVKAELYDFAASESPSADSQLIATSTNVASSAFNKTGFTFTFQPTAIIAGRYYALAITTTNSECEGNLFGSSTSTIADGRAFVRWAGPSDFSNYEEFRVADLYLVITAQPSP